MKYRVQLLASTAFSFAAVMGSASASAQVAAASGSGGSGTIITTDIATQTSTPVTGNVGTIVTANQSLGAQTSTNIVASSAIGDASKQTVYTGFQTVGGNGSGGGAGLGGVFFIDSGASLQLTNVSFAGNSAKGGQGGGLKTDSIAPFAFTAAGTRADASAYVQNFFGNFTGIGAAYDNATGTVTVKSLTLSQPNTLIGSGSGVGLVLDSNNPYPAYSSSVASVTANADGTQTLHLNTPITLSENQGFSRATLEKDGKTWVSPPVRPPRPFCRAWPS